MEVNRSRTTARTTSGGALAERWDGLTDERPPSSGAKNIVSLPPIGMSEKSPIEAYPSVCDA
jgi:hypothetical protein